MEGLVTAGVNPASSSTLTIRVRRMTLPGVRAAR
jgi:hypothetical protein